MGGDFEERSNGETRKRLPSRGILLLLSVTQPGHVSMTSVGFATLVHTRCAFIVSGAASNNFEPFYLRARENASNSAITVSTSFIGHGPA